MGKAKRVAGKLAWPAVLVTLLTAGIPYFNRIMADYEFRIQSKIAENQTRTMYKYRTDSLLMSQKIQSDSASAMNKIQSDSLANAERIKRRRKAEIRDSISDAHYQVWNNNLMDEIQCNIKRMDSIAKYRKCK